MRIARQNRFVHQQDFGIEAGGDREAEPQNHSRRVGPDRHIEVIAELGKLGDLRQTALDLVRRQAEQQGAHADVVVPVEVGVDSQIDVEHRRNTAARSHLSPDRLVDSRHRPQQRRLPCAIGPDQGDTIPDGQRQRDVVQRRDHHLVPRVATDVAGGTVKQYELLQRPRSDLVDGKLDGDAVEADDRLILQGAD